MGTPITGLTVHGPRQMGRQTRGGNEYPAAAGVGVLDVGVCGIGSAVGRGNLDLVLNPERVENVQGGLHHGQIGIRTHEHSDKRRGVFGH
jgi:hypothetical protein